MTSSRIIIIMRNRSGNRNRRVLLIISGSWWRKTVATAVAATGFVMLYEVTTLDSKYAARQAVLREATAMPMPGARLAFSATAYCKGLQTASGVAAQTGVAGCGPGRLSGRSGGGNRPL